MWHLSPGIEMSSAYFNQPLQLFCDHQCSPAWSHRLLNIAGTSPVPAACCHTPPATSGGPEGEHLLRASRHTGGLSPCQSEGGWPFEPPDIPKWTETIMWYLSDPHRGVSFDLHHGAGRSKHRGSYTTAPLELTGTAEVSRSNAYCPSLQVGSSNPGFSAWSALGSSLVFAELWTLKCISTKAIKIEKVHLWR